MIGARGVKGQVSIARESQAGVSRDLERVRAFTRAIVLKVQAGTARNRQAGVPRDLERVGASATRATASRVQASTVRNLQGGVSRDPEGVGALTAMAVKVQGPFARIPTIRDIEGVGNMTRTLTSVVRVQSSFAENLLGGLLSNLEVVGTGASEMGWWVYEIITMGI